ncbi:MAG: hypothetical protein ABGF52_13010 [Candidatus Asgardarchaeum sp.]
MENKSSELHSNVPLLEIISSSIKQTGKFKQSMTGQDVEQIMKGVVSGLLTSQDTVDASISKMDVNIKNNQGKVNGIVVINKPISASIEIDCVLGNSNKKDELSLVSLKVNEKAGFIAKIALAAVDIEGKARATLQNPNQALFNSISKQLEPKHTAITNIGLQFKDSSLNVSLSGNSTAS